MRCRVQKSFPLQRDRGVREELSPASGEVEIPDELAPGLIAEGYLKPAAAPAESRPPPADTGRPAEQGGKGSEGGKGDKAESGEKAGEGGGQQKPSDAPTAAENKDEKPKAKGKAKDA